jgi:DNA-binding transcriptional LysR family regulator
MLNLNLLRVFNAVAEHKSVVRASEKLFISQPAVSTALKKLQDEIDVRLFQKFGRSLSITEQGALLYALTRRMFTTEKEIEELVANLNSKEKQSIHMGLVSIYERFGLKDILHDFAEIDKNLSISVHSGNSTTIVQMLGGKHLDMGIAGNVVKDLKLRYDLYREHEVFLVAPGGHRLYGRKIFTAEDIRGERVVLKEPGSSARTTLDNFLARNDARVVPVMELSNIDSILHLAEAENCITFLPDISLTDVDEKRFSKAGLKDERLFFPIYVITHPPSEYTNAKRQIVKAFLNRIYEKNIPAPGGRSQPS